MGESALGAPEVELTLEVMLGGGYLATDRQHGVHTTGRTDHDALRRLHTWLDQRGLANAATVYRIRRYGRPGSVREARDYTLTGVDLVTARRPDQR